MRWSPTSLGDIISYVFLCLSISSYKIESKRQYFLWVWVNYYRRQQYSSIEFSYIITLNWWENSKFAAISLLEKMESKNYSQEATIGSISKGTYIMITSHTAINFCNAYNWFFFWKRQLIFFNTYKRLFSYIYLNTLVLYYV